MSPVLHHVQRWLPATEHFVSRQVLGSSRPAVVVSRYRPVPEAQALHRAHSLAGLRSDRAVRSGVAAWTLAARAELVHVHFGYRLRDARLVLGRRPVVVSLHGHDATAFPRQWPDFYRGVLGRVDAVVVPSTFLADRAVSLGAPEGRVHVVPAGVDTAYFCPQALPSSRAEVCFVGRLVEKKGVDVLLRAWPAVRSAVPDAVLRVVGDGPLADQVAAAGPAGVRLRRTTASREHVRDALSRSTVVCTPSRTAADGDAESLLLVNLEAQALGRPVVTTRHGGVPEFVDEGRSALLVDEGDAGALAEALVAVLTDRSLAERLASAGPAVAARFEAGRCTARIDEEVYAPLLSR